METISDSRWLGGSGEPRRAAHVPPQALSERLVEVARVLRAKPFRPHPLARSAHAQTVVAALRRYRRPHADDRSDEARFVEVGPGARVRVELRWQPRRGQAPTVLLIHGLEGSSESPYMRGTARKAYRLGFNVARLNMRTCGGTEHLSDTLYHSGMTGDIRRVVEDLVERDACTRVFVAGFSMSGNMVLRLAGEWGAQAPRELKGVCAVSPSIELGRCALRIEHPTNWLYRDSFMRSMRRRMRAKRRLHPDLYDTRGLWRVRTVRQFDERFTAPHGGFRDAADYYERSSSLPVIRDIRVPTLIIHAQDDPIIPFSSFLDPSIADNPEVLLVAPPGGGHVGFLSDEAGGDGDCYWAESRVAEFFALLAREKEEEEADSSQ